MQLLFVHKVDGAWKILNNSSTPSREIFSHF